MKVISGSYTDIGTTREVNQDSIFCRTYKKKKEYISLAVVCDGIGGLQFGEIASAYIVEEISRWWDEVLTWIDPDDTDPDIIFSHVRDAAEQWNSDFYEYKISQDIQTGTTMSLLLTVRDKYYIIQVGDSRVYLLRDGELKQLTIDATVSRLGNNGEMKSYLNNFMGKDEELFYTTMNGDIVSGDLFIVCCDGLYHHLELDDINVKKSNIANEKKVNSFCNNLTKKMMSRGEKDNISVVMLYHV